jgi:hypothetical protein
MTADDDRMHALLDRAVAGVEPRHGLDAIRRRTRRRARTGWAWGAGGAVLATAATIAAVAVGGGVGGRPAGGPAAAPAPATVFFVGSTGLGDRLFSEVHPAVDRAAALQTAIDGRADDPDYRSAWPAGTDVRSVTTEGGRVVVDLAGPLPAAGPAPATAALAVQQLVWTAGGPGRTPVVVQVDGTRVGRLLGVPVADPVPAQGADDVLAPVSVASLTDSRGATSGALVSPVTVRGRVSAFEGNVQWELVQGDRVVRRGYATARECCTLSPYTFRLEAPAGDYTLVVHDEDVSDGEGGGVSQDTKAVSLR